MVTVNPHEGPRPSDKLRAFAAEVERGQQWLLGMPLGWPQRLRTIADEFDERTCTHRAVSEITRFGDDHHRWLCECCGDVVEGAPINPFGSDPVTEG